MRYTSWHLTSRSDPATPRCRRLRSVPPAALFSVAVIARLKGSRSIGVAAHASLRGKRAVVEGQTDAGAAPVRSGSPMMLEEKKGASPDAALLHGGDGEIGRAHV